MKNKFLFFLWALIVRGAGQEIFSADVKELTAFSLKTAAEILNSGGGDRTALQTIGFITDPWALIVDDQGDLLLVGERNPKKRDLGLDELVLSLKNARGLTEDQSPGVSIEPSPRKYLCRRQPVKYFGGIENTYFGYVCFQADLLLKKMGLGLEPLGIEGIPNEWDLELDRVKSEYLRDPWIVEKSRNFFFPHNVVVAVSPGSVVLHNFTVSVLSQVRTEERISPASNPSKNGKAGSPYENFARSISDHYEEISVRHPVLDQLKQLMKLSALAKSVYKNEMPLDSLLQRWIDGYSVKPFPTPAETPKLYRGESGLAVELRMEGGIYLNAHFYNVQARDAGALRTHILDCRPAHRTLSWTVPIRREDCPDWPPAEHEMETFETFSLRNFKDHREKNPLPAENDYQGKTVVYSTSRWRPQTGGRNLLEWEGNIYICDFNERYDPYLSGFQNISFGCRFRWGVVAGNRFRFGVEIPLETLACAYTRSSSDIYLGVIGGLNNPLVSSELLLLKGKGNGPRVSAGAELRAPVSLKFFEYETHDSNGFADSSNFIQRKWSGSYFMDVYIPSLEFVHLLFLGAFYPGKNLWDRQGILVGGIGFKIPIRKKRLWSLGVQFDSVFNNIKEGRFQKTFHVLSINYDLLTKSHLEQNIIGVRIPAGGNGETLSIILNLNGIFRFVTQRIWF